MKIDHVLPTRYNISNNIVTDVVRFSFLLLSFYLTKIMKMFIMPSVEGRLNFVLDSCNNRGMEKEVI